MSERGEQDVRATIEAVFKAESGRVMATLIRLLGDFDLAEEALQEAFAAAMASWTRDGVPAQPRAWLVSTGRFRAIDMLRRRARFNAATETIVVQLASQSMAPNSTDDEMQDDRLRLIFTCCHPAIPPDAQVALTLREVCGLSTEAIARAFLTTPATIAQRIVRAKARIREQRIPYVVPDRADLPDRLEAVLRVIYLIFTEGYAAVTGDPPAREDLSREALRLGRLLVQWLPDGESFGLLSLMLLHESRRAARFGGGGDLNLLEQQDRSRWDTTFITEGSCWLERAMSSPEIGAYTLQAAIVAVHARAVHAADTDWAEIVRFYDLLLQADHSPVTELNRAVAVAMRDGPQAGLALLEELVRRDALQNHALAHAAHADLLRRVGRAEEARSAYARALTLTQNPAERLFLERRLRELSS